MIQGDLLGLVIHFWEVIHGPLAIEAYCTTVNIG
jgi:hypothetical protein